MATAKVDLYERSRLNRGFGNRDLDNDIRTVWVTELTGTDSSEVQKNAIQQALSQVGTASTGLVDVSIADANVVLHTDKRAMVVLRYGRTDATNPPIPATANVTETISYMRDFTGFGTSDLGAILGTNHSGMWIIYPNPGLIPVSRLRMTTVLTKHPGTAIDALIGKMNSDTYSFAGRSCTAKTLRFDGANIKPAVTLEPVGGTSSVVKWFVNYEFMYFKKMWIFKHIPYGMFSGSVPKFDVVSNLYGTAVFGTNIPVHGGYKTSGGENTEWWR